MGTPLIEYMPPGPTYSEDFAIRSPLSAGRFFQPSRKLLNWLLQVCKQGNIFSAYFPATVSSVGTRCYHRPSSNCSHVLFLFLVERSTYAPGGFITVGKGSPVTQYFYDTSVPASRFPGEDDERGWGIWAALVPQHGTAGLDYYTILWTNVVVRHVMAMELPRYLCDFDSGDEIVELHIAGGSGFRPGDFVSDSDEAGVYALLQAAYDARLSTKRHCTPLVIADANAWSLASSGAWGNMMDSPLATSSGFFRHQGRYLRQALAYETYDVMVRARYTGTGSGDLRVRSATMADTVTFTSLTSSFAWYAQDSGSLSIDGSASEQIYIECQTTDGTTNVEVASVQLIEV